MGTGFYDEDGLEYEWGSPEAMLASSIDYWRMIECLEYPKKKQPLKS